MTVVGAGLSRGTRASLVTAVGRQLFAVTFVGLGAKLATTES